MDASILTLSGCAEHECARTSRTHRLPLRADAEASALRRPFPAPAPIDVPRPSSARSPPSDAVHRHRRRAGIACRRERLSTIRARRNRFLFGEPAARRRDTDLFLMGLTTSSRSDRCESRSSKTTNESTASGRLPIESFRSSSLRGSPISLRTAALATEIQARATIERRRHAVVSARLAPNFFSSGWRGHLRRVHQYTQSR